MGSGSEQLQDNKYTENTQESKKTNLGDIETLLGYQMHPGKRTCSRAWNVIAACGFSEKGGSYR
jgi:hypothetical protein